jgi:predicted DNA-binding WGR domain protein
MKNQQNTDPVATLKKLLKIQPKGRQKLFRLELVDGNSSKFYECWIEPSLDGLTYEMYALYGRIGSSGTRHIKQNGSEVICRGTAEQLKREKINKGYRTVA